METPRRAMQGDPQVADAARMRNVAKVGAVVWASFWLLDALVASSLNVDHPRIFLAIRLPELIFCLFVVHKLRDPELTLRGRTGLDLALTTLGSASIAAMCIPFGGIASHYAPGICLVLLTRSLFGGEPWRRGAIMYAVPTTAYPVVMVVAGAFDASIAAQFHETRALAIFAINLAFVVGMAGFGVAGGHMVWALRRAVFEARNMGRYKLRRRIGHGATGEVWLAHHAALKRDVALKILRPELCDDVGISRFEREVRATAELAHPNTVRIFDFGATEDGLWYYAMELLEGETLSDLVRRRGPLPPQRALRIASQVAHALGEAHWRGIVHRDIKPGNLFMLALGSEPDFVKVLDFGIARRARANARGDETLTREGHILGTPAYISPEAAAGRAVDARADVYSLGAVLYFMLTGYAPFDAAGEGAIGLLMAHLNQAPQTPSARLGAALPDAVEAIVMRCLAKSPNDRYRDATELASALDAVNGCMPQPPSGTVNTSPRPSARP
jgi:serine/threonine-protein kinase